MAQAWQCSPAQGALSTYVRLLVSTNVAFSALQPMSRISAVALFNESYEVGSFCAKINEAYCQRHGYRMFTLRLTDAEMKLLCEGRHFAWGKVALLRWLFGKKKRRNETDETNLLESKISEEDCLQLLSADWLVWFDADLMVLNHEWPLSKFLSGNKDLVLGEDMADLDWLNTGLMMCKVGSSWMQSLWDKVWSSGDSSFHQGEFWDQSALCACLARWGEFHPTVVGGKKMVQVEPPREPWFSWQGAPRVRETEHIRVLDASGTQTNNPRHARFAFHAAGMKDLCGSAVHPWGWPQPERRTWPSEKRVRFLERWVKQSEPALLRTELPKDGGSLPSLDDLSESGDQLVEIWDRAPPCAAAAPPGERPWSRRSRARLWEMARYVAGSPPAQHGALQQMSPRRCWQVFGMPWMDVMGKSGGVTSPAPSLGSLLALDTCTLNLAPPNAELQMHRPRAGDSGWLLWQLEGKQQVVLLPSNAVVNSSLLGPDQCIYSPWEDDGLEAFSSVLAAGEALWVPPGWWYATRCLSASLCLAAPLGQVEALPPLPSMTDEVLRITTDLLSTEPQAVRKRIWRPGSGATAARSARRCNAVCHLEHYVRSGAGSWHCVSSSRASAPEVFHLGADTSLGFMEEILRSMLHGERSLVAVVSPQGGEKLFDLELLHVVLPEAPDDVPDLFHQYMRAWSTWFEDPAGWQPLPALPPSPVPLCQRCGAPNACARCSGCSAASYCSKSCQREDWRYHRNNCSVKAKRSLFSH
ncbi:unnamed protein product [Durusdinium trenchii]|uniref:Uncharacterized protein n=1 Tax=Durusdinium trenchii TaxID=1381693 RepID=A0ABP0HJ70_9DINO